MNPSHFLNQLQHLDTAPSWVWAALAAALLWELVWKGQGLWKSARNNQTGWFVALLLLNTLGLLPILYLLFFQKKGKN